MKLEQKILPSAEMIRSARGYLNWSQAELGEKSDLSKVSLVGIETQRQHPNMQTLKRIATAFWDEGLEFLPEGGFRINNQLIKVFEGVGAFVKLQKDILSKYSTLREVLYNGADDRLSSSEIFEMEKAIHSKGIKSRNLIKSKDSFVKGDLKRYRIISDNYFPSNDVTVVYGDNVAFCLEEDNIILVKSLLLANAQRRVFNTLWNLGKEIKL